MQTDGTHGQGPLADGAVTAQAGRLGGLSAGPGTHQARQSSLSPSGSHGYSRRGRTGRTRHTRDLVANGRRKAGKESIEASPPASYSYAVVPSRLSLCARGYHTLSTIAASRAVRAILDYPWR